MSLEVNFNPWLAGLESWKSRQSRSSISNKKTYAGFKLQFKVKYLDCTSSVFDTGDANETFDVAIR